MPDWRLVLYRSLAVLVVAIYLRTRRLAALIIAHWTMDLTAAFLLIERARTKNGDRGNGRPSSPPTPPYMRVRIRRFGGLSYL